MLHESIVKRFPEIPSGFRWADEEEGKTRLVLVTTWLVLICMMVAVKILSVEFIIALAMGAGMIWFTHKYRHIWDYRTKVLYVFEAGDCRHVRVWKPEHRSLLMEFLLPNQFAVVINVRGGRIDFLNEQSWYTAENGPKINLFERWFLGFLKEDGMVIAYRAVGSVEGSVCMGSVCQFMSLVESKALYRVDKLCYEGANGFFGIGCSWSAVDERLGWISSQHQLRAAHTTALESAKKETVRQLRTVLAVFNANNRLIHTIQGLEFKYMLIEVLTQYGVDMSAELAAVNAELEVRRAEERGTRTKKGRGKAPSASAAAPDTSSPST